jgi:hypothetical protein
LFSLTYINSIRWNFVFCLVARAFPKYFQVAAFVDDDGTNLALIALFAHNAPDELLAMSAECWLPQE